MRSQRGVIGAAILLFGVPTALASSIAFDAGASATIHFALGVSFLLFAAAAAADFKTPRWISLVAGVAIGVLGAIFLLQGIADVVSWRPLDEVAYGILGQYPERVLGEIFLLWCAALLYFDSHGATRIFGAVVLAVAVGLEAYGLAANALGEAGLHPAFKLMNLPLFVWILLESRKDREGIR